MKDKWLEELRDKAARLRIDGSPAPLTISDGQVEGLYRYMELLLEWNERMNLTAVTEPGEVMVRHFLDSAAGLPILRELPADARIADVGTGAGFPGMVLSILAPEYRFVLMDALQKRLTFLGAVREELALDNCELVHERAEEAGQKAPYREQMDAVAARAVAALPVLLEYCLPFVRVGGLFLAYKGPALQEELPQSAHALQVLGGKVEKVASVTVDGEDFEHYIAIIRKVRSTPGTYPRRQGKIAKSHL